jgi:hypothetical protein
MAVILTPGACFADAAGALATAVAVATAARGHHTENLAHHLLIPGAERSRVRSVAAPASRESSSPGRRARRDQPPRLAGGGVPSDRAADAHPMHRDGQGRRAPLSVVAAAVRRRARPVPGSPRVRRRPC